MANTEYLKEWVRKRGSTGNSFKLGGKALGRAAIAGSAVLGGVATGSLVHAAHKHDKKDCDTDQPCVNEEEKKNKENFNKGYGFGVGVGIPRGCGFVPVP